MLLVALNFVPLGVMIGRCYNSEESFIKTYGWNLFGSLIGLWLFYLVSFLNLPPNAWVLALTGIIGLYGWLTGERLGRTGISLAAILVILVSADNFLARRNFLEVIWSPYQKLSLLQTRAPPADMEGGWILVNNSGYQVMLDLRPESLLKRPDLYNLNLQGYTQYDLPFRFNPKAKTALNLGAGSGNDAAAAVRAKLEKITAVDIDPVIIDLGRAYHPERPYSSPSVDVKDVDARAFISTTPEKYDVISYGVLDSHTTGQMTNARLDHFVYTREGIEQAAQLLTPEGILTLTFEASKPHISDRIRKLLRETFNSEPLMLRIPQSPYGFGGVMFVTGNQNSIKNAIAQDARLQSLVSSYHYEMPEMGTEVLSDDWPYIYLDSRTLPPLFIVVAAIVVIIFVSLWRKLISDPMFSALTFEDGYFFLSGVGFFLLETVNISRAAVLLGSSWQPIAAIISGVLLMAFLANLLVRKYSIPPVISAALLILSCLFLLWFNLADLLAYPLSLRFVLAAVTVCLPLFFSGILFSSFFAKTSDPQRALAMNLFGAILGAILQYLSLLLGFRALLWIVTASYILALGCLTKFGELKKTA